MMNRQEAVAALTEILDDAIVVTGLGNVALDLFVAAERPLNFYTSGAMGTAISIAFGLAVAQPDRRVICLEGDGSLLMNLGCLVTLASYPADVFLVILDNGLYEVTGGQPTAGVTAGCDFVLAAKGAKFATTERYDSLEEWKRGAAELLKKPGPRFVHLCIEPVGEAYHLPAPTPITERIANFRAALST